MPAHTYRRDLNPLFLVTFVANSTRINDEVEHTNLFGLFPHSSHTFLGGIKMFTYLKLSHECK